jgi:RimJ/RimL family protein N-acetyltransferase
MRIPAAPAAPATCRRGRHLFLTERLRLQSVTLSDIRMLIAAASDPKAQRWLGWTRQQVIPEAHRAELLARPPGQGRRIYRGAGGHWGLTAVDRSSGRLAGSVEGGLRSNEVGGSLAPQFRSRGLGTELFAAAALFAHDHLGVASLRAGTEPANAACVAALLSAGFVPAAGPVIHHLPDGRSVPARWFRHDSDRPSRCRA